MEERSESSQTIIVVALLAVLLLLGLGAVIFVLRARARLEYERNVAMIQEKVARDQAQKAQALAESVKAAQGFFDELKHEEKDEEGQQGAEAVPQAQDKQAGSGVDAEQRGAITELLQRQQAAWNRGDLVEFMESYWKSEQLTFSSGGKVRRGWDATMQRYRETYPTPEKMGTLTISDLEVTPLSDTAALVLGQWKLERAEEPVGGNFSLVVRKLDGRWVIVHDHTSRAAD